MKHQPQRLKQALVNLRQALEETESVLLESDGTFFEEEEKQQVRQTQERRGQDLLSVMEVCQELGMSKTWVHHMIKSGEIPSIRLGNNIKVKREDLHQYLESQRQKLVCEKPPSRKSVV
jgi:excisionase family DNA binding protein